MLSPTIFKGEMSIQDLKINIVSGRKMTIVRLVGAMKGSVTTIFSTKCNHWCKWGSACCCMCRYETRGQLGPRCQVCMTFIPQARNIQ